MIGENSPEYACGQVFFGLKMSKLNFMVMDNSEEVHERCKCSNY